MCERPLEASTRDRTTRPLGRAPRGQRGHVHPGPYAQLEGVPGDLVVVGRLDDADEVLVSQHAVHAQDLGIMGLDGGGGPHEAFGVLEHPLATVQRQRQQQDI